jgi:hypothetical protein
VLTRRDRARGRASHQVNDFTFQDKRLDGRYDWLPYIFLTFASKLQSKWLLHAREMLT